jgi:hypothetical protein
MWNEQNRAVDVRGNRIVNLSTSVPHTGMW